MVVKYSDNIHKGFVASIAIVLAILIDSMIFQDATINEKFLLGSLLVGVTSTVYFQLNSNNSNSVSVLTATTLPTPSHAVLVKEIIITEKEHAASSMIQRWWNSFSNPTLPR